MDRSKLPAPMPMGEALSIPAGRIEILWYNENGGLRFEMFGKKAGDIVKLPAIQTKAIVMQALHLFAEAEFREAIRLQEEALAAALPGGLVKAG